MAKSDLKAFDIPLALMFKEKFNQPIFGANYLSCSTKPMFNSLPNDASVKIWFMEGGCGKFLKLFRATVGKIRENTGRNFPS
jgi:WW domain-binding protein 2